MNKLQKTCLLILIPVLILCAFQSIQAEPITYYLYLTNYEETRLGEYIWFSPLDSLYGRMRTNDFIRIMPGNYIGTLYIPRDRWQYDEEFPPGLNVVFAPPYEFPRCLEYLRARVYRTYDGQNNRFMTWIKMMGRNGFDVYQYAYGTMPRDSLIEHVGYSNDLVICVVGNVEVEGIVPGNLTIYSTGDMWLVDDIRYVGADRRTGWFEEDQTRDMLALVSERNIIIQDNYVNGRAGGWNQDPNNPARNSIIINGSLIALNESFTFEHQNEEWDAYQGPYPDERGYVRLKGSLAQWRRGYLHRGNHDGTGYQVSYNYDFRLDNDGPPGFGPGELPEYSGYYESLMLVHGSYTFRFADVGTLIVQPGVEIVLEGQDALRVRDRFEILGTEEAPVTVRPLYQRGRSTVRFDGGYGTTVDIEYTDFIEGIENQFEADTIRLAHSSFNEVNWFTGKTYIDSCVFMGTTHLECWDDMQVERSIFRDGVEIQGNVRNSSFTNNTVVGGRYAGIEIDRFRDLTVTNNVVVFNRQGIVNNNYDQPTMSYNDVYGNWSGDYVDCQAGQGSISVDPRLLDWERGDYHLGWGSPCIDAGDPNAPLDPDGSRSDMGAYPFHNVLTVPQPETVTPIEFALSAAPNPFNCSTRINLALPSSGWVTLALYDVQGRATCSQSRYLSGGLHRIYLTGEDFGAPGVYFVRAVQADAVKVVKVVYLP